MICFHDYVCLVAAGGKECKVYMNNSKMKSKTRLEVENVKINVSEMSRRTGLSTKTIKKFNILYDKHKEGEKTIMRKIYNLIMNEEDEIRIINENETLEEIYDFLDDITYRIGNISGSITSIYQILHRLEKAIDTEDHDNNIEDIKF